MRIQLGCELIFEFVNPTPMILMLNVHYSRAADLEQADSIKTLPEVPLEAYRDPFGNWCCRLVAPAGQFVVGTNAVLRDSGAWDLVNEKAEQHRVEDLPPATLPFLLGSRYCETDVLSDDAWKLFGATPPGWARVKAICDFVHKHIAFSYADARSTRTAADAFAEGRGVCRDYAHLAAAFCRCMNIPARYCTGYISDIGLPPPYAAGDFAAWIEVFLGGRWYAFDPRNNAPRIGRVLVAFGRDAADVSMTHTFGPGYLSGFKVWTDEIKAPVADPVLQLAPIKESVADPVLQLASSI